MRATRTSHTTRTAAWRGLVLLLGAGLITGCTEAGPVEPRVEPTPTILADGAQQHWVRSTFFVDNIVFIACLNEDVRFFGVSPFQYHEVVSASGNRQWKLQILPQNTKNEAEFGPFLAVGQSSGRVYEYENGGPINEMFHLGPGEVHTIVDKEVFVAENGDRLEVHLRAHLTINANGELVVLRVDLTDFECISR